VLPNISIYHSFVPKRDIKNCCSILEVKNRMNEIIIPRGQTRIKQIDDKQLSRTRRRNGGGFKCREGTYPRVVPNIDVGTVVDLPSIA